MRKYIVLAYFVLFSCSALSLNYPQSYPIQLNKNSMMPNEIISMIRNSGLTANFDYHVKCEIDTTKDNDPVNVEAFRTMGIGGFLIDGKPSEMKGVNIYIQNKGIHSFEMDMSYQDPTDFIIEFKNYSDDEVDMYNCIAYT